MLEYAKRFVRAVPPLFYLLKFFQLRLQRLGSLRKWRKLNSTSPIKLELGSGGKLGENGWTTVDLGGADISHDLRHGIPLDDGKVDVIYTSHTLEHIPYSSLLVFLAECRRVLKKGGYISICVPNAAHYINAYVEGRQFKERNVMHGPAVIDTDSVMDQMNYIAYMNGEHAYMFDSENLLNLLKKCGFIDVQSREFEDDIDLESRDHESIYAIAYK